MSSYGQLGKGILIIGAVLVVVGGVFLLLGKLGVPQLPGDVLLRRGRTTIYIPIATMIVASVVLSVVLNLLYWILRR